MASTTRFSPLRPRRRGPSWATRAVPLLVALGLAGCDDGAASRPDDAPPDASPDTDRADDAAPAPGDSEDVPGPEGDPRPGGTEPGPTLAYQPLDPAALWAFPDDWFTAPDPAAPTGLRLAFGAERAPFVEGLAPTHREVFDALDALDGFGTTAGIIVRPSARVGALPEGLEGSTTSSALQLWDLSGPAPSRVPFEVRRLEDVAEGDWGLVLHPAMPLSPGRRHAFIATRALRTDADVPFQAGPVTAQLLAGQWPADADGAQAARVAEALEAAGTAPADAVLVLPFTTQSLFAVDEAIAAQIRAPETPYTWAAPPTCEASPGGKPFRRCDGRFVAADYRGADGVLDDRAVLTDGPNRTRTYELDVTLWLPLTDGSAPEGPWPLAMFGHGLAHQRDQAGRVADAFVPSGMALVAVDAVAHGDHPDAPDDESMAVFSFFEVTLEVPVRVEPLDLRDNFRQSAFDKLQLLELLARDPDVDGDGAPDLHAERWAYVGESFGGIMAVQLLALTDRFEMAGLQLSGGRVTSIVEDATRFMLFGALMTPDGGSRADSARLFPVLQTLVERGDPSNWARFVLTERGPLGGTTAPHLMLQLVIDDDTIPDTCSTSLVRAMGLPHVGPAARPVEGVPLAGEAPVASNLAVPGAAWAGGSVSAGFFQFDRITRNEGDPADKASHDYTPSSQEGKLQFEHWVNGWLDHALGVPDAPAAPELLDPYQVLGTPHLPDD